MPEHVDGKLAELLLQDPALRNNLIKMFKLNPQSSPSAVSQMAPSTSNYAPPEYAEDIIAPIDMKTDLSETSDLVKPVPRELESIDKMEAFSPVGPFATMRTNPDPFDGYHHPVNIDTGMEFHTSSSLLPDLEPPEQTPSPPINFAQSSPAAVKPVTNPMADTEDQIDNMDNMELPDSFHPKPTGFTLPSVDPVYDQAPVSVAPTAVNPGNSAMIQTSGFQSNDTNVTTYADIQALKDVNIISPPATVQQTDSHLWIEPQTSKN